MSRWRIFRKWHRWAVAEATELYWDCRCLYHNAATYRCYFCGSRRPMNRLTREPLPVAMATETTVDDAAPAAAAAATAAGAVGSVPVARQAVGA